MKHPDLIKWKKRIIALIAVFLFFNSNSVFAGEEFSEGGPAPLPEQIEMVLDPGGENKTIIIDTNPTEVKKPKITNQSPEINTPIPERIAKEKIAKKYHPISFKSDYQSRFNLSAGYRYDSLDFNIAGSNHSPTIISELQWTDISSFELSGSFRWSGFSNLFLRGHVGASLILDGNNQDSDYLGDNRTQEFSRSYADTDHGSMFDASLGIGYRFDLSALSSEKRIRLIPLVGYSYHSQEVEDTNGVQVISDYGWTTPLGPFSGLQSTYEANWTGPWAGVDFEIDFNRQHSLLASLEYHWADFDANADWNLRTDLKHPVSFTHDADGDGIVASLTYQYKPSPKWAWTLGVCYRKMATDPGHITFFISDDTTSIQPLNEVNWESFSVNIGLTYHF